MEEKWRATMCRGGKDKTNHRCKVKPTQRAQANLRKKIKYRADKEGVSVEEWKTSNPDELAVLVQKSLPKAVTVGFQPVNETRRLADDIPSMIADHMKLSMDHIESRFDADERKALAGYTGFAAGVTNTVLMSQSITDETLHKEAPLWRSDDSSGPCDFSTREDLIDYLETMDSILSERQDTQRVLYRGIPIYTALHEELEKAAGKQIHVTDTEALLGALQEHYKPGKVMHFPTYVSTTHSAYYAAERTQNTFGTNVTYWDSPEVKGIVFEMKTNAGLDVTGAARHNSYEREVVLPRDTHYRIESISLRPESYDTVSGHDYLNRPKRFKEENFTSLAVVVQMVEVDQDGNEITHADPHKPAPLDLA